MLPFCSPLFDIDERYGFLPSEPPLRRLYGVYEQWELLFDDALRHIRTPGASPDITVAEKSYSAQWRARVQKAPILPCKEFEEDVRKCRRAHHVLAFIVQFYVHSSPTRDKESALANLPIMIPAPISIPFIASSRRLGIAPVVTYGDAVLWNWEKIDPTLPLSRSNIRMCDLFTGSPQEEHFFLTSARIEIRGWEALDAMECCVKEAESDPIPISRLVRHLRRLQAALDDITTILLNVKCGLDPDFFYNLFRPWIQGADQGSDSPHWCFEGVDGVGLTLQPSGPSAGQSALMHSFDAFLDVFHPHTRTGIGGGCTRFNSALNPHGQNFAAALIKIPTGHPTPLFRLPLTPPITPPLQKRNDQKAEIPSVSNVSMQVVDTSFNARMRSYMPEAHDTFLLHLARHSIRPFVEKSNASELKEAFNACVIALKKWRDAHVVIVTQFVILPARRADGSDTRGVCPAAKLTVREPVRGTGGTSLIPLLKTYRDNTLSRVLPVIPTRRA